MSERSQKLFLKDNFESVDAILSFIEGFRFDLFCADRKTFSTTIREFEIIEETLNNISNEIKTSYPEVIWQEIRSFRNKIVHEYFGVMDILSETLSITSSDSSNCRYVPCWNH